MIIDKSTPSANAYRVFLDGKLIGRVHQANLDEHWVDVYEGDKIVRKHGRVSLRL